MKLILRFFVVAGFFLCHTGMAGAAVTEAPRSMKIALVHYGVKYKDPEQNLKSLLRLNRDAAREGAKLILNTELAVSGYSFTSRQDVAPYTETDQGKTIEAMAALAGELGVYIGITFPERDPLTDSYYNSAFVLDPRGRTICKYRKIYTERRWARSGSPYQDGTFDTPWGRVGVAICADSYFGLIPRTMAIKGVDLLWVPANWPPTGYLSPQEVWRARAIENGFYLAACNRTGKDRVMDCKQAVSGVFDPNGKEMCSGSSESTRIFLTDIPLDAKGRFAGTRRHEQMNSRNPRQYRQIYLTPWVENLTSYYRLPEPGLLDVHCFVPVNGRTTRGELETAVAERDTDRPALWVLPQFPAGPVETDDLLNIAGKHGVAFAFSRRAADGNAFPELITPQGERRFAASGDFPFQLLHYGPAVIAMVPMKDFRHPELAVVLAKLGCDLVVVSGGNLSSEDLLLSHIRVVNGVAVAACGNNEAQISCMQGLHGNLDRQHLVQPGVCSYGLDTVKTRAKLFLYSIDYDLLLR